MSMQAGENISEDTPPTLPGRRRVSHPPVPNQNLSNLSDVSVRLYPSLDRELSALNLDGVVSDQHRKPIADDVMWVEIATTIT